MILSGISYKLRNIFAFTFFHLKCNLSSSNVTAIAALQGGVCLAFADEVLCWLYGTVRESK
jgi:hypothetical protein